LSSPPAAPPYRTSISEAARNCVCGPGFGVKIGLSSSGIFSSGMITVSWNTNEPASGKFYYSQTPFALTEVMTEKTEPVIGGFVVTNNNYNTSNSLQISNLNPATTYYYIIQARDAAGNVSLTWPNTFRTQ
jgi:hypothetical protein